jgi:hypothetical protein
MAGHVIGKVELAHELLFEPVGGNIQAESRTIAVSSTPIITIQVEFLRFG